MFSIRDLFRYKVKSFKEFIQALKDKGCKRISVEPYITAKGGVDTASVGLIANFQYWLEFTAMTPSGRRIVYRELLFERFGSDCGFSDEGERYNAANKLFLFGKKRAKELQDEFPNVPVDFIDPSDVSTG